MPTPSPHASCLWATVSWGHVGKHSAMAPLSREVEALAPGLVQRVEAKESPDGFFKLWTSRGRKLLGPRATAPWLHRRDKSPFYGDHGWRLESEIDRRARRERPRLIMLEALEEQFLTLGERRSHWPDTQIWAVCHQPPAWWRLHENAIPHLQALDRMIVVSQNALQFWREILGDRVAFIPHGVDVDFFRPAEEPKTTTEELSVVFSGQWLRDFETLAAVVRGADARALPVAFDLIVPRFAREQKVFYEMAMSPRVRLHAGLDDEALRMLYRKSDLMLQPLLDSTANNGVLEGLACGLPLIVTDVGGVRDYVKETFATLVPWRDPAAILEALTELLRGREMLAERGKLARVHAAENLSWKGVAAQYIRLIEG